MKFINIKNNTTMRIKDYQTIVKKTAIYPKEIGLAYCAMGLTGEAGEVADKVKKLYRDKGLNLSAILFQEKGFNSPKPIYNIAEGDKQSLKKELGDVLWYIAATANELGLTLGEIMEANYNKLIKRRDTGTLQGSGDNREEEVES